MSLDFLFYIGVKPVNNVVLVSDARRRYSARHIHVSIFPQIPLPFRLFYMLTLLLTSKCKSFFFFLRKDQFPQKG